MSQLFAALDASWRILLIGLVLGSGLPVLFAFGIRAMAWGSEGGTAVDLDGPRPEPHPVGRWIAYAIFGFVVLSVLLGIGYIVAHGLGMTITFNGIWPVFTPKG